LCCIHQEKKKNKEEKIRVPSNLYQKIRTLAKNQRIKMWKVIENLFNDLETRKNLKRYNFCVFLATPTSTENKHKKAK